jgi:peptide chain release factor 1
MYNIIGKLELIKERWEEIGKKIIDPEIISDMKQYVKLTKEYSDLEDVVKALDKLKSLNSNIEGNRDIIKNETDPDFVEMAKEELSDCESQLEVLNEEIKLLLIPKDPEDSKNVVVEIRAGAGGDEASIFAGDLHRMYTKYASTKKWQVDIVDTSEGTNGGYKEVIFEISGANVYGEMKYESGVHRVQRVPQTETQGRVHTSAASVIVLPEAEEFDIEIKKADLRVDSYCSSGPGGQSVNTTYSAIRLTHLPTGVVAQCQDQKSKLKNYDKALSVLRSRVYEIELQKKLANDASTRKSLVSSSDRSAKIRTYNYAQGRVTDHRINLTLYNLSNIIDGDISDISEALKMADMAERMQEGAEA